MKTKLCFVATKKINGKVHDCRLMTRAETGLGSYISPKKGLLVACATGEAAVFAGEKSMDRAISKTQRAMNILRGSLVDTLPSFNRYWFPEHSATEHSPNEAKD
jgi:hypothetical protein